MAQVLGFDHVQISPLPEQFDEVIRFYTEVLNFTVARRWIGTWGKEPKDCAYLKAPNGIQIEVFTGRRPSGEDGAIKHFALNVDDVDGLLQKAKDAGFQLCTGSGKPTEDPHSTTLVLDDKDYFALQIGFIKGPTGEIIELVKSL